MSESQEFSGGEQTHTKLSSEVIAAVAEAEGVSEIDLEPPLFEAVNPDALNNLFHNATRRVQFDYLGYTVTVDQDGTVDLAGEEDT
ncbi:hypothetical protein C491_15067 [Natronococcus amylolyticus DSM 10524]|uniref:Halobacterial output domain-containing protein n=1 Tax=Natronococcus amylolyticus DSM 10524 TaxID=1227497 RepID=L9X3C7_9EURY|nr:HalOD1 output domain-containing protein [Natronococcus amylolyticus]ELY56279.1 hypothetical protein C491_15067 [Natronococcus amylolyticus DSM 10524]